MKGNATKQALANALKQLLQKKQITKITIFYAYAFMGVVMEWIQRNMAAEPQQVAATTAAMIQVDFRNSLENMSRYESKIAK